MALPNDLWLADISNYLKMKVNCSLFNYFTAKVALLRLFDHWGPPKLVGGLLD